jgi:hypothetical protein
MRRAADTDAIQRGRAWSQRRDKVAAAVASAARFRTLENQKIQPPTKARPGPMARRA